jgi:RNA polymerase sigma factor (sigma-70 family)
MRTGHDELWAALLENRERATRVALARCGDGQEAEDIVQEALARVAAMPNVDLDRIGPLLSAVVGNLAVDAHRRRARTGRLEVRLSGRRADGEQPDEAVCDAAEARWLWSLREGLAARERDVLELRIAGRSVGQAAADLGVSYKAAENALGRARARLRAAWAATAAVISVLLGRRPGRQPVVVLAVAPVVAIGAAVLPWSAWPADGAPATGSAAPAADAAAALEPARVAVPEPTLQPGVMRPDAASQQPLLPPAAPSPTPTERVVSTKPLQVSAVDVAPAAVERREPSESFLDTTMRCLRDGPVVTPQYVGCR